MNDELTDPIDAEVFHLPDEKALREMMKKSQEAGWPPTAPSPIPTIPLTEDEALQMVVKIGLQQIVSEIVSPKKFYTPMQPVFHDLAPSGSIDPCAGGACMAADEDLS